MASDPSTPPASPRGRQHSTNAVLAAVIAESGSDHASSSFTSTSSSGGAGAGRRRSSSSNVPLSPSRAAMIAAARSHPRASAGHVDPELLPEEIFSIGNPAISPASDSARRSGSPARLHRHHLSNRSLGGSSALGGPSTSAISSPLRSSVRLADTSAEGHEDDDGSFVEGDTESARKTRSTQARARQLRRTIDLLSEDEDDDVDEEDHLVSRDEEDDTEDPLSKSVRSLPSSYAEAGASNLTDGRFRDRNETAGKSVRLRDRTLFSQIWTIAREAIPSLTFSVVSLILTGQLLVHLARWPVFLKVDKLFILIPILLNLKGNLEMNLSLRMSTSANIGELDIRRTRQTLIAGNLALLQVQALIVSAFAGTLAFVLGVVTPSSEPNTPPVASSGPRRSSEAGPGSEVVGLVFSALANRMRRRRLGAPTSTLTGSNALQPRRIIHHHPKPPTDPALRLRNGYFEFVLVLATGMLSASFSSAILGSFMCALVVITRRMGGNPDNIASPLAASLGDLLTLTILGLAASALVKFEGTVLATIILAGLVVACLSFFVVSYRNAYVRELLTSGWVPLLVAMFISSGAGLVLDAYVQKYEGFALLVPISTGLPGAAAAIFASRISTALHSGIITLGSTTLTPTSSFNSRSGIKPPSGLSSAKARVSRTVARYAPRWLRRAWNNVVGSIPGRPAEGWLVPATLFGIVLVIDIGFLGLVQGMGEITFGWRFALCYLLSMIIAVCFALCLSHAFCHYLWAKDYDPVTLYVGNPYHKLT
ncbi:hypothetical protein OC861_001938 [Tilletia horrida]|nr:hypothetical protein OC861_001938 [Tilletia horrida]